MYTSQFSGLHQVKKTHKKKYCPAFVHTRFIPSHLVTVNIIYLTKSNTSWSCWNSFSPSGSTHLDKTSLHKMSSPIFFRISMQETSTPSIFCHFLHPALTVQKLRICQIRPFSYLFSPFQTKNNLICFVFSQLFRKTKQLEQTQFAPEKVGKHLLHPHPLCLSALIWHRHTQVIWRVANQVIQLRKYTNSLRFGRKKQEIPKFSAMKSYEKLIGGNFLATLEML